MDVRKIVSPQEKERQNRRRNIIVSVVLGLIMLFSTAGYAFFTSEESKKTVEKDTYNGLELTRTDYGSWKFKTASGEFETKYSPRDTENISVTTAKSLQSYAGSPLYFGIDSKEDISQSGNYEILLNMQAAVPRSNFACLSENCSEDYPVKNCSDSNILIFRPSMVSRVYDENGCVVLEFSEGETEKTADAFLFRILGVK